MPLALSPISSQPGATGAMRPSCYKKSNAEARHGTDPPVSQLARPPAHARRVALAFLLALIGAGAVEVIRPGPVYLQPDMESG